MRSRALTWAPPSRSLSGRGGPAGKGRRKGDRAAAGDAAAAGAEPALGGEARGEARGDKAVAALCKGDEAAVTAVASAWKRTDRGDWERGEREPRGEGESPPPPP